MMNIRSVILLAGLVVVPAALPVQATPMPAITAPKVPPLAIQVRDHGHWHGHHGDHRRDHRFHGRDDYYDRDDQSGVVFKSFITGTLFR